MFEIWIGYHPVGCWPREHLVGTVELEAVFDLKESIRKEKFYTIGDTDYLVISIRTTQVK